MSGGKGVSGKGVSGKDISGTDISGKVCRTVCWYSVLRVRAVCSIPHSGVYQVIVRS